MRLLFCAAALSVAGLATGCVSASTVDVPQVERELVSEAYTELCGVFGGVRAGAITVTLQRGLDRTYAQSTTVDRQVRYAHWSLAAASIEAPEGAGGRVAMIPVAIVASVVDLVGWIVTAPVAYPLGAFRGIDPGVVEEQVTEQERFDVAPGEVVLVRVGEGAAAREVAATVGDHGRLRFVIEVEGDAEPALASGRTELPLEFRLQSDPAVHVTHTVGLAELVGLVEARIRGDLEERHFRWRRIHDAIPVDAPGAAAVKAALQAKIAPIEQALR